MGSARGGHRIAGFRDGGTTPGLIPARAFLSGLRFCKAGTEQRVLQLT
jgi:hypothetical protein